MKFKLVGIQRLDFKNSAGEQISGTNIYCAYQDENTEGARTEKFFLKEGVALPQGIKVNDLIDVSFNMKGKVESVSKAN